MRGHHPDSVSDGVDRSGISKEDWEVGVRKLSGDMGEDNVPKVEQVSKRGGD